MVVNNRKCDVALERFELIAGLLAENLDRGRRQRLLNDAAEKAQVSIRTIQRWLAAYKLHDIEGAYASAQVFIIIGYPR